MITPEGGVVRALHFQAGRERERERERQRERERESEGERDREGPERSGGRYQCSAILLYFPLFT